MADEFTVWRIHECNANFLKNFIGDKHRLILWLSAFFLIFWNRGDAPATEKDAYLMVAASGGAFLLFALQSLIVNKLFGRETELLAGWFLLACPGFLVYARYGMLQPLSAGMVLGLTLYMAHAKTFGLIRAFFFGFLCGVTALCSSLCAGILLPLTCVGFLRKAEPGKRLGAGKILLFLCGASVTALPMLYCPGLPDENFALSFRDWWTIFALGFRNSDPAMEFAPVAILVSPLFWTAIPALDAVHRRLTEDRLGAGKLGMPLLAVIAGCLGGTAAFGLPAVLPCLAVCSAWLYTHGQTYAAQWCFPWDKWIRNIFFWLMLILVPAGLSGYFLPNVLADAGFEITRKELYFLYFRMPGAAIAVLAVLIFRKLRIAGKSAGEKRDFRRVLWWFILPALSAALLILVP